MDSMKCKVRFMVTTPCSPEYQNIDSWTVDGDRDYARRTVIKLAYKYMNEVVNDALYDPMDCTLEFVDTDPSEFTMPTAIIKHKGKGLYFINAFLVIQIDNNHFQYRDYVITIDESHGDNGVCHVVDGRNGFYVVGYDIIDGSVSKTLSYIYRSIDLELSKGE